MGSPKETETWSREINDALWNAARLGKGKAVKALLKAGADANSQSPDGNSALIHSVSSYSSDPQSVAALLKAGADPESCSTAGETALICAARQGSPEIVAALLKAGASTEIPSKRGGMTALMEAALHSNPEVITVLLKAGADNGKRNIDGCTALSFAAHFGTPETVAAFLDQGVYETKVEGSLTGLSGLTAIDRAHNNPQLPGTDALRRLQLSSTENYADNQERPGWTPLMHTIMTEPYDPEAVAAMLNSGTDIDGRSSKGDTALIIAARHGRLEAVKALLEAGADPEAQNRDSRTALMVAVRADEYNHKVIAALLSGGANLEAKDRDGKTALFYAVLKDRPKAVCELLIAGANIKAREKYCERTAFMWAVSTRRMKAAAALLKAGADVEARDGNGDTVITIIEWRMESRAKPDYPRKPHEPDGRDKQDAELLLQLRGAKRKTTRWDEQERMAEPQQGLNPFSNGGILPWKK